MHFFITEIHVDVNTNLKRVFFFYSYAITIIFNTKFVAKYHLYGAQCLS